MQNGNIYTRGVTVCPFRGSGFDTEFLILHKCKGSSKDLWQIVAGKPEVGETIWQGALREVEEETGIRPVRFFSIGVETFYKAEEDAVILTPAFAAELPKEAVVKLSDEHDDHVWLPYEMALLQLPYPSQRETLTRVRFVIADPSAPLPMEIPQNLWVK